MKPLTNAEKAELKKLIDAGGQLPGVWMSRLFPGGVATQATQDAIGKEYRLVYEGKLTREEVLAQTPAAPWQLVRSFCDERPFEDGWQNLLVWGDNLLAMRELLADQRGPNRFGTRDKIKLVYIDPPFATRQDFLQDKEKAYRDKVAGSQFIEFLRRRLILIRELLASDGSVYVHLGTKKGHYIKAIMDEVFGEHNFQNEIVWKRTPFAGSSKARAAKFPINHDLIFFYSKSDSYAFSHKYEDYSAAYKARFKYQDANGFYRKTSLKTYSPETEARLRAEDKFIEPVQQGAYPSYKQYLHESKGKQVEDIWMDLNIDNPMAQTRSNFNYPTIKPESLLERIITASSSPGDIVMDCFAGSGTTPTVAEKLGRRWIAMDCGKLAVYIAQKRMFSLTTRVGTPKEDERDGVSRVEDWSEHEKKSRSLIFITEKARRGECDITVNLLSDLATIALKHRLIKDETPFAIVCPEEKLKIKKELLYEPDEGPGTKAISVEGIEFRISFVEPKRKLENEKPLLAQQFALYRAGVYDMTQIQSLPWDAYRPLVMKLFGVREAPHTRYGFAIDGYVRGDATLVWNYPENPKLRIDHDYVRDLHKMIDGKPGERIYVIAPVVAMGFMEDEVQIAKTTYVFLKVPVSVLMRLIEHGAPAALPQPMNEGDVNEVIDAVGFDFVSQPLVEYSIRQSDLTDGLLKSFIIAISQFRAQTLATDADDFRNFETLSMVMLDLNYDGDVFRLSEVHWGEELLKHAGGLDNATSLTISIPSENFVGDQMMMILCDRYGNEKALVISKSEFKTVKREVRAAAAKKATNKKSAAKKSAKRKASGGSR